MKVKERKGRERKIIGGKDGRAKQKEEREEGDDRRK